MNYVVGKTELSGNSIAAIAKSTNYHLMRLAFEKSGDPSPRSIVVTDCSDLIFLDLLYPPIVKPTVQNGRCGVSRVNSMNSSLIVYAALMLFGVFVSAISQVIMKKASQKTYRKTWKEYLIFPVITAYYICFFSTLLTVFDYRVVPLSMGPILESTSYVYVTIFGAVFFRERITGRKILSLALILAGSMVYTFSF